MAAALAGPGAAGDEDLLVAAILHDTVEDTQTNAEELAARFGRVVAELVLEVTDDKSLPKEERKRLQVEHAADLSERAKQLKIADKICNVRDVALRPAADWSLPRRRAYLDWSERVVAGCRGVNPTLEATFDEVVGLAREALILHEKLERLDAGPTSE